MTYMVEVLRQEHRNIESLLRVLERELSVFDRGERPDYEVVLAVIDYFKDYPDTCHHPKEDMIVERLKARDPIAAATIGDLEAEHQEGAKRLRRVAQAVERVLSDQDLLLVLTEKGEIVLVEADPAAFKELGKIPVIEGKTWNHPVLVRDLLLVRNSQEMVALRL